MTKHDAIKHLSYKIAYSKGIDEKWADSVSIDALEIAVRAMAEVKPKIIKCKDCKHWKDSDGIYRRGFDAESKCPLNLKEVYEGTFYCGKAEMREENENAEIH